MSTVTKQSVLLNEIHPGDIFSEESHYVFQQKAGAQFQFKHLESGNTINLDEKYVQDLLITADQYHKEVEVGKEDKLWTEKQITEAKAKGQLPAESNVREGDVRVKGIRSIWAGIYSSKVFTVSFNKQDKAITGKALIAARDKQLADILAKINPGQPKPYKGPGRPRKDKTVKMVTSDSITIDQFRMALAEIQNNPVLDYVPGEERILRGYKTEFSSINGIYDVIDMDVKSGIPIRKVNVNEINWLVIDGFKFIVK